MPCRQHNLIDFLRVVLGQKYGQPKLLWALTLCEFSKSMLNLALEKSSNYKILEGPLNLSQALCVVNMFGGLGSGGGLVVSVLTFYSYDPSSDPAGY